MAVKKQSVTAGGGLSYRAQEALGLIFIVLAVYVFLCLYSFNPADPSLNNATVTARSGNIGGLWGGYLADGLMMMFGVAAYAWPLFFLVHGAVLVLHRHMQDIALQIVTVPTLLVAVAALLQMWQPLPHWPDANALYQGFGNGGLVGKLVATLLVPRVGWLGSGIVFGTTGLICALWLTGLSLYDVVRYADSARRFGQYLSIVVARQAARAWAWFQKEEQFALPLETRMARPKLKPLSNSVPDPVVELPVHEPARPTSRSEAERQATLPLDLGEAGSFTLPPLSLLEEPRSRGEAESVDALTQNARRIEAELKNFGVEGRVSSIKPGPVITIYELEPAAGVKTSQIVGLSDDLARAMSALAIRIAPKPGRNVIGIEMPNRHRQGITLRELLDTEDFETHSGKPAVAMGVDTAGKASFADIAKMPHALIAGTTGSGKSVAMNAFIISLLYRLTPDELRFVMVDPKMLELSIYNEIPHLLTPVITDPNKAAAALGWVVREMENRYRLMSELGVKNLASFNAKFTDLQAKGEVPKRMVQTGFDIHTGQPRMEEQPLAEKTMPHIVVVIDELADLMMVAGKTVELYIARLTQMARASGVHLLVATQRPSVDVVTGLIKANIPTRISFSVASRIDSRTVLDSMGAEQLLGKGDMLFLENGSNQIRRMHGAYVSEEECNAVAAYLKKQGQAQYIEEITKASSGGGSLSGTVAEGGNNSEDDELYQQAIGVVAREQKASTSFLQRHLKVGYNKAADLIDRMEKDGFISPANHVGKREVIVRKPEGE